MGSASSAHAMRPWPTVQFSGSSLGKLRKLHLSGGAVIKVNTIMYIMGSHTGLGLMRKTEPG